MQVAALYDIHGNLPALEAVLEEIRQADVDQVVVGGDVVPGPMPRDALTCLMDFNTPVRFIQGNGEREVLAQMAGVETGTAPKGLRAIARWVAGELQPEHQRLLTTWPGTLRIAISEVGETLFCHATPETTPRYSPV